MKKTRFLTTLLPSLMVAFSLLIFLFLQIAKADATELFGANSDRTVAYDSPATGTRFVDATTGNDTTNCTVQATPCATIGYALTQAEAGEMVWVTAGTYLETLDVFRDVTLQGGYIINGSNWLPYSGETIIDANGADLSVVNIYPDTHVFLESFTIQGGDLSSEWGGGVFINQATVVISNTVVQNNHAPYGGGILIEPSPLASLTLINSAVLSNTSNLGGAGVVSTGGAAITLERVEVRGNVTQGAGGGLRVSGSLTMTGSIVANNTAIGNGGGIDASAPGSTLAISDSQIVENTTINEGGGIFVSTPPNHLTLTNSAIISNTAGWGGGLVSSDGAAVTLENVDVHGNTGLGAGGLSIGGDFTMTGSAVVNNAADSFGGGLSIGEGAAFHTIAISGSEISQNSANAGGGISIDPALQPVTIAITNTALLTNTAVTQGGGLACFSCTFMGTPLSLHEVVVRGNVAQDFGGGLAVYGPVVMTNSQVLDNVAGNGRGGGIHADDLTSVNTSFIGNEVNGIGPISGGGVSVMERLYMEDSLVAENVAIGTEEGIGGGINVASTAVSEMTLINTAVVRNAAQINAGINLYNTVVTATNSFIVDNTGTGFGGNPITGTLTNLTVAGNSGNGLLVGGQVDIVNTISWGNNWDYFCEGGCTLNYSDIGTGDTSGAGNISADPLFIDPDNGNHFLQATSPAIDAGTNTNAPATDFEGDARPYNGITDMGADEWWPPTAPTNLSATAVSQTQINLTWADNASDETNYRIERSPDGSTGWVEIDTAVANATSYSDTGLTCDTAYHYRVRAYRAGDGAYSSYSNVDTDTTVVCDPPTAPTNLVADAISQTQINLTWTDNATDETNYRIERSPDGSTGWVEIDTAVANATSYSDSNLTCNTEYFYRVRAYRDGDATYSSYSNVDSNTTTVCDAPAEQLLYLPLIVKERKIE
jgi:hypothetical protein